MLLTEKVLVKWNPKTKRYYENLGYIYTRIGDSFYINVSELSDGSNIRVKCQCDYCGKEYDIAWYSYVLLKKKQNKKDCCNNPECISLKSKESMIELYGVKNARDLDFVNDKIRETNLKKYGCENPFSNDEVKDKIIQTNIQKYNSRSPMQNKNVVRKAQNTCLIKYGVKNYGAIYASEHKGALSPTWKGGVNHHRVERATFEYRDWRKQVFSRDHYTCQCCGDKSKKSHKVELHAHHIFNWKDNANKRYSIDNGITLCNKCHYSFHSQYGKSNNNQAQLDEFLNMRKKLC